MQPQVLIPNQTPQANLPVGIFLSDAIAQGGSRFDPWAIFTHLHGAEWAAKNRKVAQMIDDGDLYIADQALDILQSFGFYAALFKGYTRLHAFAQSNPGQGTQVGSFQDYLAQALDTHFADAKPLFTEGAQGVPHIWRFHGQTSSILWTIREPIVGTANNRRVIPEDAEICLLGASAVAAPGYVQAVKRLGFAIL
jgi:hypothetical protein